MILMTFIIGAFALAHFIFRSFDYGIYIYMAILLAALFIGWRKTFPENQKTEDNKTTIDA